MEPIEKLIGKCPSCLKNTEFAYCGKQENIENKDQLYYIIV